MNFFGISLFQPENSTGFSPRIVSSSYSVITSLSTRWSTIRIKLLLLAMIISSAIVLASLMMERRSFNGLKFIKHTGIYWIWFIKALQLNRVTKLLFYRILELNVKMPDNCVFDTEFLIYCYVLHLDPKHDWHGNIAIFTVVLNSTKSCVIPWKNQLAFAKITKPGLSKLLCRQHTTAVDLVS